MTKAHGLAVAVLLASAAAFTSRVGAAALVSPDAGARSERYTELDPILLPETVRIDAAKRSSEFVFAFVVDTLGRVELSTIQTLLTTDSVSAFKVREKLSSLRYTPARIVRVNGPCVRINDGVSHCGGASPVVIKLRKKVLLRLQVD